MRIELDPDADALYLTLSDEPYAFGKDVDDSRRVDYAADGSVVGIEILFPSRGVDLRGLPIPPALLEQLRRETQLAFVA
jgi:uncharacterized protein YuzE